jgi:hypothetical protein
MYHSESRHTAKKGFETLRSGIDNTRIISPTNAHTHFL